MSTGTPPGIRYHYVITLQFEQRNGIQPLLYTHGVITPEPGQTRSDLFRQILKNATVQSFGVNPVPLFFSLEPDELPVPAALNGAER